MKNNPQFEYLAKKIFHIIFHEESEIFDRLHHIQDHTCMPTGIVDSYSTEWISDDKFKYEVKVYSDNSLNKGKIEARVYKPSFNPDDADWHDDYDEHINYDEEAEKLLRGFRGGLIEAYSSKNQTMFFRICAPDETPNMSCWRCTTGFIDTYHTGLDVKDVFHCPICDIKLDVSREIKTIYKSDKID